MRNVEFKDGQENDFCAVVSKVKKYAFKLKNLRQLFGSDYIYIFIYIILRFIDLIARIL